MTCGAHTASQPWRRHRRARDTCPETPDINRATSRAPRALSCTYTFDPVQWVGTCKRNRPEPTKHAPAMPMARVPVSLVRVSKMTKSGPPFPIWQRRQPPPLIPPQRPPCPFRGSPCSPRVRGGTLLCALRRERVIIALSRSVVVPVPSFPVLAGVGERARELRAARLPPARQQRAVQLRTLGVRRPDAAEQLSVLLPKQNSPQKNFDTLAPVRPFGRVTQIQPIFSKRSHPLRAIQATPSDLKARLPTLPDP